MTNAITNQSNGKRAMKKRGARIEDVHKRMTRLQEELQKAVIGRDDEVRAIVVAAVAGEHVVMLGPPGTAKTQLARAFAVATGQKFFWALMTRFTTPEELFGPMSLTELQRDRFVRNTADRLPEAEVVLLDEVFKAGSSILNALLTAMNERVFHNGGKALPMPLRTLIGASNEMPEDEEALGALWDRFLVRLTIDGLRDEKSRRRLLEHADGTNVLTAPADYVTAGDIAQAHNASARLRLETGVAEKLMKLQDELREKGIYVSDRRMVKCVKLLQAAAWMDGESEVTDEQLPILRHALWDKPENEREVRSLVAKLVSPEVAEAQAAFDACAEAVKGALSGTMEQKTQAAMNIERCGKEIKRIRDGMPKSRARAKVNNMLKKLLKLDEELMKSHLARHKGLVESTDVDDPGF